MPAVMRHFPPPRKSMVLFLCGVLFTWMGISLACSRTGATPESLWNASDSDLAKTALARAATQTPVKQNTPTAVVTVASPTPDPPRILPTLRAESEQYIVQPGDHLALIAQRYNVTVDQLVNANGIADPNYLEVGQVLIIPSPVPGRVGSDFKIIPDVELVYGPSSVGFNVENFTNEKAGYLATYQEAVDEVMTSGAQIVQRVAQEYSVNPRLLLAVLESQSGWVTQARIEGEKKDYPIIRLDEWRKGLYYQLSWAANQLNRGYYLWRVNAVGAWLLPNGDLVPLDPHINAGTAGIQYLFSLIYDRSAWDQIVSAHGLEDTYQALFGSPFVDLHQDPVVPVGVEQPQMQLPFEPGVEWAFTGGPHGGWGDGSAWAALDFAPPGGALGCVQSNAWVVAVADGLIVRSGSGEVIQDIDETGAKQMDGLEQTGWVVLYMHIESRDRVQPGDYVKAGDRIGHPSCEGGFSSGTHVHLARRYNGEWISADRNLPFNLDGWISEGAGEEYNGYLKKGDLVVEAWEGFFPVNMIGR
jgi:LasA protease